MTIIRGALVSTAWLRSRMSVTSHMIKVLDSSSTPLKNGREDYLSKHIPSAQFFDLTQCVTPTSFIPRNLPDPDCMQDYVRSLGVNKHDDVVVYDRGAILASCRAWWTFRLLGHERVSVLDGGLKKWEAEGSETESGEGRKLERGDFEVNVHKSLLKTFEDVVDMSKSASKQIIDARKPEHFQGVGEEPATATVNGLKGMNLEPPSSMKKGHIKGSINLMEDPVFDPEILEQYKVFLGKDKLMKVFQDAGIDLNQPLTTMCYLGNAASVLALAGHLCGKHDVSVYYGGWTEFGQRGEDENISASSQPPATGG